MELLSYPARLKRDEDGRWFVQFVDLPEAYTDGAVVAEAMKEAADCLASVLSMRITGKEDIPLPSRPKRGQAMAPVPLWIAGKVVLYRTMREQGVSNVELARRLGVGETTVRRMSDPGISTRQERLEQALQELGKRCGLIYWEPRKNGATTIQNQ